MDTGAVFTPTASVFLFQYHPTNAPQSSLVYMLLIPEGQRAKTGNAKNAMPFLMGGGGKEGGEKYFTCFFYSSLRD